MPLSARAALRTAAPLLAGAVACAVPPTVVDGLPAHTAVIADAVARDAAAAERLSPAAGEAYAGQARAWRAVEDYAWTVSDALTKRQPTTRAVAAVQRAFVDLHAGLRAAVDGDEMKKHAGDDPLGLGDYPARITLAVGDALDAPAAVRTLHPVIAHLGGVFAEDARRLEHGLLPARRDAALAAHEAAAAPARAQLEALRARREELRDRVRMQAAGVGEVQGDPAAELARVREELATAEAEAARHAAEAEAIRARWDAAIARARDTRIAWGEWVVAHRELARALGEGEDHASMRLLAAAARDHARH